MMYCPVCKVVAYRNHRCPPNLLIPIKRELRTVVDQLFRLDIPVLSASWFSFPVEGSYYEHHITMHVELSHTYPTTILGDFPTGWVWYTETVTEDHLELSCIGYSEVYVWLAEMTVDERVCQIIDTLVDFLKEKDADAVRAITLLSG